MNRSPIDLWLIWEELLGSEKSGAILVCFVFALPQQICSGKESTLEEELNECMHEQRPCACMKMGKLPSFMQSGRREAVLPVAHVEEH